MTEEKKPDHKGEGSMKNASLKWATRSEPWLKLSLAIPPNMPLKARTEWKGGGSLALWDILSVGEAARLASRHAGVEISVMDFCRAAGRGEILLRAPASRAARITNHVGNGILQLDGKPLEDSIEEAQMLYIPFQACQRLAEGRRASWREIVMQKPLKPGVEDVMQFTIATLADDGPDFQVVAESCLVSMQGMHALADDFILQEQAAITAAVPETGNKKRPPQTQAEQERVILEIIKELGHDPKALPSRTPGKPWVKSEV